MCGIVAYIAPQEAHPILIKGLKRLEYRGYDSAGIAILNDTLKVFKTKGKVADLEEFIREKDMHGTIGMAHTVGQTYKSFNNECSPSLFFNLKN